MRRLVLLSSPAVVLMLAVRSCVGGGVPPVGELAAATIVRDGYGVAHVYGESREAAWFGVGYAQAQDDIEQVRRNLHAGAGRLAENGLGSVNADLLVHRLHIPQASQARYETLDLAEQAFVDAFTDGINAFIAEHDGALPGWVTPVEPWEVLAASNAGSILEQWQTVNNKIDGTTPNPEGSNAFAIGATRSSTGRPMVGGQPQTAFSGPNGPRWEFHVSYPGVNAMGAGTFGEPGILVGGNELVAWSGTNNVAHFASADTYWVPIDPAGHPGEYLFEGQWVPFTTESYEIDGGQQTAAFARQGPVARENAPCPLGVPHPRCAYVARLSYFEDVERLHMGLMLLEAQSIVDVKAALRRWQPRTNFIAADAAGNLLYVYSVKAGIRPPGPHNWARAVDGSTSATDWQGIVAFDDLPRIENPPGDAIGNANDGPWLTLPGALDPADFPPWLVWLDGDTERGLRLRDLLAGGPFDLDGFADVATDSFIPTADAMIPVLGPAWAAHRGGYTAAERQRGDTALADLQAWNRVGSLDSTAMTVYTTWVIAMDQTNNVVSFNPNNPPAPDAVSAADRQRMADAFRVAVNYLQANIGTIAVPWGDVHQVERTGNRAPAIGGWNRYYAGTPKVRAGSVFEGHIDELDGNILEVRSGSSYVFTTELGAGGRFLSAHPWGNSPDPASPHFFDQAASWGAGELKDTMRHDRTAVFAAAESVFDCDVRTTCTAR